MLTRSMTHRCWRALYTRLTQIPYPHMHARTWTTEPRNLFTKQKPTMVRYCIKYWYDQYLRCYITSSCVQCHACALFWSNHSIQRSRGSYWLATRSCLSKTERSLQVDINTLISNLLLIHCLRCRVWELVSLSHSLIEFRFVQILPILT